MWLSTAEEKQGLFEADFDPHALRHDTTSRVEGVQHSQEEEADADVERGVGQIQAHHLWLMFLLEIWKVGAALRGGSYSRGKVLMLCFVRRRCVCKGWAAFRSNFFNSMPANVGQNGRSWLLQFGSPVTWPQYAERSRNDDCTATPATVLPRTSRAAE